MIFGVFLMVLIPYGVISLAGASVGVAIRGVLPAPLQNRVWNRSAIALVVIVAIAHMSFHANARYGAKNEAVSVVDFVKTNNEVLSKAGSIKTASIHVGPGIKKGSSTAEYHLYVVGDKTVFPVVRVLRNSSPPQIVLACVSEIPYGKNDPFKDPCAQ
ncbi:MAG: hypothetical protein HZC23_05355 [Rhodocyclales bacterium]|nr:hypothetical protein [Rhodocyclales bacterium]